jgi:hypothetical protein
MITVAHACHVICLLFLVAGVGEIENLDPAASNGATVPAPDGRSVWSSGKMITGREKHQSAWRMFTQWTMSYTFHLGRTETWASRERSQQLPD